jgi:hypothetical protein
MILSVLDFRDRFTLDEKRAIYVAADSVVDIKIWLDDLASVTPENGVDTADVRTIEGVQGLEAAGLIAAGRAQEILGTEGPAADPVGGFTLGQMVRVLDPFTSAFPDTYEITGFGPGCVEILSGPQFDPSFIEAV